MVSNENMVVWNFRTTTQHGAIEDKTQSHEVNYYNLDVIISVGYRVKSLQGTQFRIWATRRLRDYIIKGFALNDERFKSGSSMNYFRELLDRIREIRLSERFFYQQIKDIYATSVDYDPSDEMTLAFYKEVQNKLLWAVSGKTAAELVYYRANASLPQMGLTSTSLPNKVSKADVEIGKNYLTEEEIGLLKLIVEQFLAYAETQAMQHKVMYMRDWLEKLKQVLTMNDKIYWNMPGRFLINSRCKKLLTNMINTRWHKSSWSIWRVSKSWSRMFRNCMRLKNEDSELLIFLYFCRVF